GVLTYKYDTDNWGYSHIVKWSDLVDREKGFIKDGKITVEIYFSIVKMTGFRRKPRFDFNSGNTQSDVILIIEGKPVHVNKHYLRIYSNFFHSLFFGEFANKEQKEFELEDVVYE
ncbi:hypothetical protein PMAYCL1PPCAC_24841, partial [Pristionchus mayeri]